MTYWSQGRTIEGETDQSCCEVYRVDPVGVLGGVGWDLHTLRTQGACRSLRVSTRSPPTCPCSVRRGPPELDTRRSKQLSMARRGSVGNMHVEGVLVVLAKRNSFLQVPRSCLRPLRIGSPEVRLCGALKQSVPSIRRSWRTKPGGISRASAAGS